MLNSISLYLLRLKAIFLKRIFILQAFSSPKTPYQVLKLKRLNPPKLHIQTIKTNPHKNCPLSLSSSMDDSVLPAIILRNPPYLGWQNPPQRTSSGCWKPFQNHLPNEFYVSAIYLQKSFSLAGSLEIQIKGWLKISC